MNDKAVVASDYDDFLKEVDRGLAGGNSFIPVGIPKLNRHIGLGQGVYILIGGESGTGKTALTDELFVLNPYDWYINNQEEYGKKLRIIYRSMERSKTRKIAKWVCRRLWLKYHVLIDVPTMLGWMSSNARIPSDVYQMIKESRDYFEKMFDIVQITDGATNPTGMYKQCRNISFAEGFLIKSNDKVIKYFDKSTGDRGKEIKQISKEHYIVTKGGTKRYYEELTIKGKSLRIPEYYTEYFPDNPDIINVIIGDHNGKWKNEQGFNSKETLDKASEYYGELRDIYKWTPIAVNQFNRNISDTTRRVKTDLSPEKQDFKGSGNMYEDADFVAALFNPYESNLQQFKGYQIRKFTSDRGFNRFRSLHILKNTYGIDNITTGLNFIGENGSFHELKKPSEMNEDDYKYAANPTLSLEHRNVKFKRLV